MSATHPYRRSQQGESSAAGQSSNAQSSQPSEFMSDFQLRPSVSTKESKRMRGEIACAECRRLKIKCDRKVPCTTCVKRGCSALCPNGTIPPGDGSRFVLAATDHLHQKMSAMEARMHALEDALAIAQSAESDTPHPLLTSPFDDEADDELKLLKPIPDTQSYEGSDSLGMLHLDPRQSGAGRFFGPSGGSESLLIKTKELEALKQPRPALQELDTSYLPAEVNRLCRSFPFTPPEIQTHIVQNSIESLLPPVERAIALTDTFLEHLSWMFQIVSRRQVVGELIPSVYKLNNRTYGPHDLALMLIVLAVGALVDLDLAPYNLEAQHYYHLAMASLTLQPVLAQQSVVTVKTLHLMSIYNGLSGKESNLEQSYMFLNLAASLALGIGFHVDPSSWGFQGKDAYERRVYFWNLLAAILWQSLITGRPPAILQTYIHCRMPSEEEEELYQQGEVPLGFGTWGFKASEECLLPAVRATLSAKPPPYSTIIELDKKIRQFTSVASVSDDQSDRTALSMRTFVRSHYQDLIASFPILLLGLYLIYQLVELVLLFLHRGFFAQAMTDNPDNPLKTPYSESVAAAYHSACVVLEDTQIQFTKKPFLCARIWRIWSYAFSAAIIIGAAAIHQLNFEPPPFDQFEIACSLFQKAAETSSRAARALPILFKMRTKAHMRRTSTSTPMDDDELAVFGGRFRSSSSSMGASASGPSSTQTIQFHYHPLMGEVAPTGDTVPNHPPIVDNPPAGWDSLYRETPGPSQSASHETPPSNVLAPPVASDIAPTFDIRWSSFMGSHGIGQPYPPPPPR